VLAGFLNSVGQRAAFNVLLIHSEADFFLPLAAAWMALNSSGVTRTRKVSFLALPFGNGGLPAFPALVFFELDILKLLNDCRAQVQ
jgi:hypothetical protein